MKIGFIGTGNIGILIARDLAESGNPLTVYDVMPEGPEELNAKGANIAASPAEVAQNAEIIGICVRTDQDVHDVMEGTNGILSVAKPGILVLIHSTVRIDTVHAIAAKAKEKGVHVMDAPVSRGVGSPQKKGIVFMLGGAPEDVARAEEFVKPAAKTIVKTGQLGTGMAIKICNNLLTYTTMVMANDAAHIAEAAGLDVNMLAEVTANNGVAGGTLTWLFKQRAGEPLPSNIVPPPRDSVIGLGEKDLDCALEAGRHFGLQLPAVEMSRKVIRQTVLDQQAARKK